jgi:DNA-binding transcriptional ArsR family regulator
MLKRGEMPTADDHGHRLPNAVLIAALCQTLSTVTRIRILGALIELGEADATALGAVLDETKDTIYSSINALVNAELIEQTPTATPGRTRARRYAITESGEIAYRACQEMARSSHPKHRGRAGATDLRRTGHRPSVLVSKGPHAKLPNGIGVPGPPSNSPAWFANAWLELPPRERVVLDWRSGPVGMQTSRTEIGRRLGISREAVRRLEFRALAALVEAHPSSIESVADGRMLLQAWLTHPEPSS